MSDWGPITCLAEQPVRVAIGSLALTLERSVADLTTSFEYPDDEFWNAGVGWKNAWRTVVSEASTEFTLRPVSPPRNIVAKPVRELYVPPGATITLFIGYPAWLQVVGAGAQPLADLATQLMAETWLGPNTYTGQLAYATPTQARLILANLPKTAHTIRAPVTIENTSERQLNISRLSIPAPELATYIDQDQLWSAPVIITCEDDLAQAQVEIGNTAPGFLDAPQHLSDARLTRQTGSIRRAIGFLFD